MRYALVAIAIALMAVTNLTSIFGHPSHNVYILWLALGLNLLAARGFYPTLLCMAAVPIILWIPQLMFNGNTYWVMNPYYQYPSKAYIYSVSSILVVLPYVIFFGNVIAQFTGKVRVRRA